MLRFHLDESVSSAVAAGSLVAGIDVTTSTDSGLRRAKDDVQLEFARTGKDEYWSLMTLIFCAQRRWRFTQWNCILSSKSTNDRSKLFGLWKP